MENIRVNNIKSQIREMILNTNHFTNPSKIENFDERGRPIFYVFAIDLSELDSDKNDVIPALQETLKEVFPKSKNPKITFYGDSITVALPNSDLSS